MGQSAADLQEESAIRDHRSIMKSCVLGLKLLANLPYFVILSSRSKSSLAVVPGTPTQALPTFRPNALDPHVAQPLVRLA